MKEKIIDILFFFIVLCMIGLDIYGYFRPEDLIDPRIHLLVNALVLAMMGYMIYSLSYKLAHVPVKEKYIKPSMRRRRV